MSQNVVIGSFKPNWLLANHASDLKEKELCKTLKQLDAEELQSQADDRIKFDGIQIKNDHSSKKNLLLFIGSVVGTFALAFFGASQAFVEQKSQIVHGRVYLFPATKINLLGRLSFLGALVSFFIAAGTLYPPSRENPHTTIDQDRIERLKQKVIVLKTAKKEAASVEDKAQINTARKYFKQKLNQIKIDQII